MQAFVVGRDASSDKRSGSVRGVRNHNRCGRGRDSATVRILLRRSYRSYHEIRRAGGRQRQFPAWACSFGECATSYDDAD